MKNAVSKLIGGVIVSCQAYEDTPLYGSDYMQKMAMSALMGGAIGIRACWSQDVKSIRQLGSFPIVGINKIWAKEHEGIFITPTYESAVEIIEAGADIIALDCRHTTERPKEVLEQLLRKISENYPDIALMADCATYEECEFLDQNNLVDILSTTLSRENAEHERPDVELVRKIKKNLSLPLNAEGRIWEQQDLIDVLEAGADMVTIGTAITRPQDITMRFVKTNNKHRGF